MQRDFYFLKNTIAKPTKFYNWLGNNAPHTNKRNHMLVGYFEVKTGNMNHALTHDNMVQLSVISTMANNARYAIRAAMERKIADLIVEAKILNQYVDYDSQYRNQIHIRNAEYRVRNNYFPEKAFEDLHMTNLNLSF